MAFIRGTVGASGRFGVSVIPKSIGLTSINWAEIARKALPARGLPDEVNEWRLANSRKVIRRFRRIQRAAKYHAPLLVGSFAVAKIERGGRYLAYGVSGLEVVTNAFVAKVVDEMQTSTGGIDLFKWHAVGTSSTAAPAAADTGLTSELTSTAVTGGGRASGTQTEGSSTNIYETVGTNTIADGTPAIVEAGVFNSSSTGSGTLVDRDTFSTINLSTGDSIQTTYDLTFSAGG